MGKSKTLSPGGKIHSIFDPIGAYIARKSGLVDHTETFSDLQVSNLITPGNADAAARSKCKRSAQGNLATYFHSYRAFQRNYRRKYSSTFLTNIGYNASSAAQTSVPNNASILSYLQANVDINAVSIDYSIDKYLGLTDKGKYSLQFLSGYNRSTGEYIVDDKLYTFYGHVDGLTSEDVTTNFLRNYIERIEEYLTLNYSYDYLVGTIIFEDNTYSVGGFSSSINGNNEYTVVCTHIPDEIPPVPPETAPTYEEQLPSLEILIPIEVIQYEYSNVLFASECLVVQYDSSIDSNILWITASGNSQFYVTETVAVTAIVPLKINNVIQNLENKRINRLFKKLNIDSDSFIAAISNKDIDSAYLLTGVNPQVNIPANTKVLFEMFDLMSPGNGNVTISVNQLSLKYQFSLVRNFVSGSIGAVGTYTRDLTAGNVLTLRYQGTVSEYKELVISNFLQTWVVSGTSFSANFNTTDGYCRLVVPLNIYNRLKYKDFVDVYENGLCMVAYATETVEVRWYESEMFGTILKIVAIIVMVIVLIFTWEDGGSAAGLAYEAIMSFVKDAAIAYVAGMAISEIATWVAEQIGGVEGAVIGAIVGVVIASYFPGGNGVDLSSGEVWLKFANSALNTINQQIQHELSKLATDAEAYLEEMADKIADLKSKLEDESDKIGYFNMFGTDSVSTYNPAFMTIEQYCSSIHNTEFLVDGSWMFNIDYEVAKRKNVVSGPTP